MQHLSLSSKYCSIDVESPMTIPITMFCGSEYQCQSVSGIVSVQFLGAVLPSQIARYLLAAAAPEREMSKWFAGNLDNVPGNKDVRTAVVERRAFGQFNWVFDSSDIDIDVDVGQKFY